MRDAENPLSGANQRGPQSKRRPKRMTPPPNHFGDGVNQFKEERSGDYQAGQTDKPVHEPSV
jgi:hypothetical protein